MRASRPLATLTLAVCLLAAYARGEDAKIRIPLPKKSKPTPVQKLNREGVQLIKKHRYEKAKELFFRAYLLDPNDPFTLNNLGYISELEGDAESAQRYYALAANIQSDALVDKSNVASFEGKPVDKIAGRTEDKEVALNRINVQAMSLLQRDRAPEADVFLQKALALDPNNPFTLNNLGFAKEKEGELENALAYYEKAAQSGSDAKVIVAANRDWRGKPIREIAEENAKKVRRLLEEEQSPEAKVARLNLMGVSSLNRNDRVTARHDFEEANKLAPTNAFTLNNMGYLAELDGDRETAEFYYAKAREAQRAQLPVGVATRPEAEGQRLQQVALENRNDIDTSLQQALERRRQSQQPVLLKKRDNTPVIEPAQPPPPIKQSEIEVVPGTEAAPAAGAGAAPTAAPANGTAAQPATNTPAASTTTTTTAQPAATPAQPAAQQPVAAPAAAPQNQGPPAQVVVPYDAPVTPNQPPPAPPPSNPR